MTTKACPKRVIITKPDYLAGKKGTLNGDRFKYPSQSFWVQPILLDDGSNALALTYEECMDEAPIKVGTDPTVAYDYQACLQRATCHRCGKALEWKLTTDATDDRFCQATCCLTRYSMVPEKVRIVSTLAVEELHDEEESPEVLRDDDFLRELQRMNLVSQVYDDDDLK